jgi:hypothetical protein
MYQNVGLMRTDVSEDHVPSILKVEKKNPQAGTVLAAD